MNKWIIALKKWNAGKSKWCVPRKGSSGHREVMNIVAGKATRSKQVKPKVKHIVAKSYKERVDDVVSAAEAVATRHTKKSKMYKMRDKIRGE